jgi:hypothetical protein
MRAERVTGSGRPGWTVTAGVIAALMSAAALAGGAVPAAAGARSPAAGTISAVAGGTGTPDQATKVGMIVCGVTSAAGSLYVPGGTVAWKVSPTGRLTTVAGTDATGGKSAHRDGGPVTSTWVDTCGAMAVDHAGNVLIADVNAKLEQVVVVAARTGTFYGQPMTAGHVYSVAGNGKQGPGGSGVRATRTALSLPWNVTLDGQGNVVIADSGFEVLNGSAYGSVVRVVAVKTGMFYGRAMKAGDIYTVAGNRNGFGYSGDGGPATKAALGDHLGPVQADPAGNLLVPDGTNNVVRVVAVRTGTFYGQAMKAGDIYTVAGDGTQGFSGDGGPATTAELSLGYSGGVAVDATGNTLIADSGNQRIRVVAARTGTFYGQAMTAGHIYTVAGDGTQGFSGDSGLAASAELSAPSEVTVDTAGNLVIADAGNSRIRVAAARTGTFYGQAMTARHIYTVAGNGTPAYSGDGGLATRALLHLGNLGAVAADAAGNTVIADTDNSRIRAVATSSGTFYGQAMTARHIYTVVGSDTGGYSGDGGPADRAKLSGPTGLAVGAEGNLVIADTNNSRIRVVAARTGTFYGQAMMVGDIYTVAGDGTFGFSGDGCPATSAELGSPGAVAVDSAGNLLFSDAPNDRIRMVAARTGTFYGQAMTAGDIYTVAGDGVFGSSGDGGPATKAELYLNDPGGVAVDGTGNLVLSDSTNSRIRVVAASSGTFYGQPMTAGDIYTVAGDGTFGFSGDGGPATSAELSMPQGVAVDAAGNLVVCDGYRVRVVAARTGTFYGQPMTAGDIYTVAGDGVFGFSGDGGPASGAELGHPDSVAVDPAGDLLIADSVNNRIRMVTGGPVGRPEHVRTP